MTSEQAQKIERLEQLKIDERHERQIAERTKQLNDKIDLSVALYNTE
jgi:hypothetical protein